MFFFQHTIEIRFVTFSVKIVTSGINIWKIQLQFYWYMTIVPEI